MQPKSFLNFLSKEWLFINELFDISRKSSIDHVNLVHRIRVFYPDSDPVDEIKRFENAEIIEKDLSYGSNYTLTDKTDQIVELILEEQQLGLSESIRVHVEQFEKLSLSLLDFLDNKDEDGFERTLRKINQQIVAIKRQVLQNYKGIENLVIQSKKKNSLIPVKQRYADVISAWEEYIIPMGDFVKANDIFDASLDVAVARLNTALVKLDSMGSQWDIKANIHLHKLKIEDMKDTLFTTFSRSKALLEPLYKTARLNSRVTKGVSTILDLARKQKFDFIDKGGVLSLYKKEQGTFLNNDLGIIRYYLNIKEIKDNPPPPITIISAEERARKRALFAPPLNKKLIFEKFGKNLPIEDATQWVIDNFPNMTTSRILEAVWLIMVDDGWITEKQDECRYKTQKHLITGRKIKVRSHG